MRPASMLLVFALLIAPAAFAGSVFLNGVNIDGVNGQSFEKVNVRIDERGDVHIDAPGYTATVITPGSSPAKKITHKYWLATEEPQPGMAEFDIDLYINGKWLRRVKSGDDQVVADITKHLVYGKNVIVLNARKVTGPARKSASPEHFVRVIIGEGSASSNQVTIEKSLVQFTRSAAETKDVSEEFVIEAR